MKAWLQSADLSTQDFEADLREALARFSTHNWTGEARKRAMLDENGKENCPAGLGLVRDDGNILHICPEDGVALVYYHCSKRFLGFLWSTRQILTPPAMPMEQIPALIRNFYERKDRVFEGIA